MCRRARLGRRFYTGLNYLCYDFSGDEAYRKKAEEASITLKKYVLSG